MKSDDDSLGGDVMTTSLRDGRDRGPTERLLMMSSLAFYPTHWDCFRELCQRWNVRGYVIADSPPHVPDVHQQLGWVTLEQARREPFSPEVLLMPQVGRQERNQWLSTALEKIRPHAIWLQEEPFSKLALDLLRHYEHDPQPRIVTALCENIFWQVRWWERRAMARHWKRLNGLLATASVAVEAARRIGMPKSVPTLTLVAGDQSPPASVEPLETPFERTPNDFVVGFCGRICWEKGWQVLLEAIRKLPNNFKLLIAGSGREEDALRRSIAVPEFAGRVFFLGSLPKQKLWSFYRATDCLVLPSRTVSKWMEQFGAVLADAMAMGLPIIGSDSGAIPEVIGPAGLVTREGDSSELAEALRRLQEEPGLKMRLAQAGLNRFKTEFCNEAYARKIAAALGLSPTDSPLNHACDARHAA